ncbi:YigZ family protein [Streptococcus caprae]|uniref:YigZ family protein n=1 Tax=Streptococcus caprae TaxID=1640501 RepID=A0ABV8CWB9_9STRE
MNYKTIAQDGQSQEDIKKSTFICHVKRVTTEEEARNFITTIKKEHYKANHNCSAFILGEKSDIKRTSDDGEPAGTAGVPMLAVLEKHELTDIAVVVTRYFGGIKLGAGGLIRAYGGAVAKAIEELGKVQVKTLSGLEIQLSYPQYQTFAGFLSKEGLIEQDTQFEADIKTSVYLEKEAIPPLIDSLNDYYHGKVATRNIGEKVVELPVA